MTLFDDLERRRRTVADSMARCDGCDILQPLDRHMLEHRESPRDEEEKRHYLHLLAMMKGMTHLCLRPCPHTGDLSGIFMDAADCLGPEGRSDCRESG